MRRTTTLPEPSRQPAVPDGQPGGTPQEGTAIVRHPRQVVPSLLMGRIDVPGAGLGIGIISRRLPDDSRQLKHLLPQILYLSSQEQVPATRHRQNGI